MGVRRVLPLSVERIAFRATEIWAREAKPTGGVSQSGIAEVVPTGEVLLTQSRRTPPRWATIIEPSLGWIEHRFPEAMVARSNPARDVDGASSTGR